MPMAMAMKAKVAGALLAIDPLVVRAFTNFCWPRSRAQSGQN
jgi:hypothetical protein